jgi:uncharacterized protein (DUF983 family)
LRLALTARCPRCGKGPLYRGVLLALRERCPVCGLSFAGADVGDGTAVPVILVLGTIVVVLAFWVEFTFSPPLWVHAVLWPVVTVPLAILLMRPVKAALVAQQYRTRPEQMASDATE